MRFQCIWLWSIFQLIIYIHLYLYILLDFIIEVADRIWIRHFFLIFLVDYLVVFGYRTTILLLEVTARQTVVEVSFDYQIIRLKIHLLVVVNQRIIHQVEVIIQKVHQLVVVKQKVHQQVLVNQKVHQKDLQLYHP